MKRACPNCGIETEGKFCSNCGTSLTAKVEYEEQNNSPETEKCEKPATINARSIGNESASALLKEDSDLKQLEELLARRYISQEEFDVKKEEILEKEETLTSKQESATVLADTQAPNVGTKEVFSKDISDYTIRSEFAQKEKLDSKLYASKGASVESKTLRKNYGSCRFLMFILVVMFLIAAFAFDYGGSAPTPPVRDGVFTTTADEFLNKVNQVIASNDELSSISVGITESVDGGTLYQMLTDSGKLAGVYGVYENSEGYITKCMFALGSSNDASTMAAVILIPAMALDDSLTLDEAKEIVASMAENGSVENNGVEYFLTSYDDVGIVGISPADSSEDDN